MFGKGKTQKSENDKYVMAMGRKVGNLKPARPMTKPAKVMRHRSYK